MAQGQDAKVAVKKGGAMLTRRSLFELAGLAIATAGLPDDLAMAMQSASTDKAAQGPSPVMDKLSTYMSEASGRAQYFARTSLHCCEIWRLKKGLISL